MKKEYIVILVLLAVIFIQRACCGGKTITSKKEVQYDTIYKPTELPSKVITKYVNVKGETIFLDGKVDTIKVREFELANDYEKDSLYNNAIKIRQYRQDFSDSIADISIFAETQGELLKLSPTLKLKATLPEKKTVLALYAGTELIAATNPTAKVNLYVQNKRGDLITGGYDLNKNIYLGYSFRIINIKK